MNNFSKLFRILLALGLILLSLLPYGPAVIDRDGLVGPLPFRGERGPKGSNGSRLGFVIVGFDVDWRGNVCCRSSVEGLLLSEASELRDRRCTVNGRWTGVIAWASEETIEPGLDGR